MAETILANTAARGARGHYVFPDSTIVMACRAAREEAREPDEAQQIVDRLDHFERLLARRSGGWSYVPSDYKDEILREVRQALARSRGE